MGKGNLFTEKYSVVHLFVVFVVPLRGISYVESLVQMSVNGDPLQTKYP